MCVCAAAVELHSPERMLYEIHCCVIRRQGTRSPFKPRRRRSQGLAHTEHPHVLLLVKLVCVQDPSESVFPVLKVYRAEDSRSRAEMSCPSTQVQGNSMDWVWIWPVSSLLLWSDLGRTCKMRWRSWYLVVLLV